MTLMLTTRTRVLLAATGAAALTAIVGCSFSGSNASNSGNHADFNAKPIQPNKPVSQTAHADDQPILRHAIEPQETFVDPFSSSVAGAGTWSTNERLGQRLDPMTETSPTLSLYGGVSHPGLPGSPSGAPFDGSENIAQVSFAPEGADFDPDVSSDGTTVVFASTQHRKTADIYTKAVDGRTVTQLTTDPANDVMPCFSPDGSKIAFSSDRDGSWDIYIMGQDGGQAVQITSESTHELHPTWSPDGKYLAYCRLGATSGRWELWVTEAGNPAVRKFLGYGLFPEWAPTGNKIAFQRSRERGGHFFSVWTLDYVDGEGVNLTEIASSPVAAIVNPAWSPDGRRLAFATIPNPDHKYGERPENADIWIIDIDGGARANLTNGLFVNLMPTWGKDNAIYFVSDRSGRDNLWSIDPSQAIVASGDPAPKSTDFASVPTRDN
ncbi:MAG: PD40 domain-containing protein [Phycisphaeraceae bacterium]|nr:PD40 domain-containing protein [Phycisphaeraceae bacterium]MCB9848287.1 PD40 domain-containing protein [Phycisphaeraceae bacterium]